MSIRPEASASSGCTITSTPMKLDGTAQQADGGSFVDNMPSRLDIRSDTSNGSVEKGIPLRLIIRVYDADGGSCVPLVGAKVDIWNPNSQGRYSGIKSMQTSGKNFLRGNQLTHINGLLNLPQFFQDGMMEEPSLFTTKYAHSTGQKQPWNRLAKFNDSINQKVHQHAPYKNHGPPPTTNKEDIVFSGTSA